MSRRAKITPQIHPVAIYDDLLQITLAASQIEGCIRHLRATRLLRAELASYFLLMLAELRASISQEVVEAINQFEIKEAAETLQKRLAIEKRLFP